MELSLPPRYELDPVSPLLGEGGMGRVFRVRDRVCDLPVALKVVRPDLASDRRFRDLFDLEVRLAARFSHPRIAPLHDVGVLPDGTPFLGVALADAGSFGSCCDPDRPPPTWPDLRAWILELADGLAYLHARGVLHRDIKPENVLLHRDRDGIRHVWLTDLGLASEASALARRKGRREGTPGYMAPEQAAGLPREFGPWTDLYSVGVVVWAAATGGLPFGTQVEGSRGPLPEFRPRMAVPPGLADVLSRLLHPDPLGRYDLAADFARDWDQLGAGLPSSSADPGAGVLAWNRPPPVVLPAIPRRADPRVDASRASLALFALADAPLVARDDAVASLWSEAHGVVTGGRGRAVVVVGEAGCGKSHLIRAVAEALEAGGHAEVVPMAWSRPASEDDGFVGATRALLRPWRETRVSLTERLRRLVGRDRGRLDDAVLAEIDALTRWCGLIEPGEEPVPDAIALRFFHRHLAARAWRGLVVVLQDDVQWADADGDGLAIGETVLRDGISGVLVLTTVRTEDLAAHPTLAARVDALVAAGATRLDLRRLDHEGTQAVLAASLALEPSLAAAVTERCAGNPLFARQILREWVDQGWLVDRGDLVFRLADGVDVDAAIPADARALLVDRVAALARASGQAAAFHDAVHMAALFGAAVPVGLLPELGEEVGVPEIGAALYGSGLFRPDGPELLRFDLGLLHQAIRERALARADAASLQLRLARRLVRYAEKSRSDLDIVIGRLALAAGAPTLAAAHLVRAAERAWRRGHARLAEEAAELAVKATLPAQAGPVAAAHPLAGWARFWWATALVSRGDGQRAADLFVVARRLLRSGASPGGAQRALAGLAGAELLQGHLRDAERCFRLALEEARTAGDSGAELRAWLGTATVEMHKRNFEGASILFTRVAERGERVGDRRAVVEALLGGAAAARWSGDLDEARSLYDEAEEALGPDDDLQRARISAGRGAVARQLPIDAEPRPPSSGPSPQGVLEAAAAAARQLGADDLCAEAELELASWHLRVRQPERARVCLRDVLGWASRNGRFDEEIRARLGLARASMVDGDVPEAARQATAAASLLERAPAHRGWAPYRLLVAALLAEVGDPDGTHQWLWAAADLGVGTAVDIDRIELLEGIATRARAGGWPAVGRVVTRLLQGQRVGSSAGNRVH